MQFNYLSSLRRFVPKKIDQRSVYDQDALAIQIQRDQFMAWVRHSYVMYPIGAGAAVCLLCYFRSHWDSLWIELCSAAMMASYLTMIVVSSAWLHGRQGRLEVEDDLARIRLKLGAIRAMIGLSWGGLLIALNAVATIEQRPLLYAAAVALMSTSIFGGSFIYGITFWLPITGGFLVATLINYPQTGPAPLICLVLYATLTLYSIFYLSKKVRDFALSGFELKSRNEIIKLVLHDFEEVASDWLWEADTEMTLVNISPRLATMLALDPLHELTASIDLRSLVLGHPPIASEGGDVEVFVQRLVARQSFSRLRLPIRIGDRQQWWMLSGKPRFSIRGDFIGYHGVGSDVTESYGINQRIEYIARHDALTGTYNRLRFNEILTEMFDDLANSDRNFCLISVDLDNFKTVNDTHGHATGDELLQIVAERIAYNVNADDVVARIGGDEFYILNYCSTREEGFDVANRIINDLNRSVVINERRINGGASAGISYAPWDSQNAITLLNHADIALYHAKKTGRGICCQFDDMVELDTRMRAKLEADLHAAVDQKQFELVFQPIFALKTSRIVGVEALIRWRHPTRGLISPIEFIETAERIGLIEPIGRWVISKACRIGAALPFHIKISINLSPLQLRDQKLVSHTTKILEMTGMDPGRVEFEITESAVLDTTGPSMATLEGLRGLGVRFALDDFGTGHSSLSLLHRFNFDRIKIDKSFTADLLTDKVNRILVENIISLSRSLDMEVTVEGIETLEQADFLRRYDEINVQGYLFGKPSPIEQISFGLQRPPAWLEDQNMSTDAPSARANLTNVVLLERQASTVR